MTLLFLPPNCTSTVQLCDMGVIRSFKCHFRRGLLQYLFDKLENSMQRGTEKFQLKSVIDAKVCMTFIKKAAQGLDRDTIRRCWLKSTILPSDVESSINKAIDETKSKKNLPIEEDLFSFVFEKLNIDSEKAVVVDMFSGLDIENVEQSLNNILDAESQTCIDEEDPDDDTILNAAKSIVNENALAISSDKNTERSDKTQSFKELPAKVTEALRIAEEYASTQVHGKAKGKVSKALAQLHNTFTKSSTGTTKKQGVIQAFFKPIE